VTENPFSVPPVCVHCDDIRRVTKNQYARETVPCPWCGDDAKREGLERETFFLRNPRPTLEEHGLTDEERLVVRDWRSHAFHMADCLRWVEGRRYDPAKDPEFANEMAKE
jgi:hypothetical protein